MIPNKKGQIAKFHTILEGEAPDQLYVVLEILEDNERPRAEIQALNTSLTFPPINTVSLNDLEVVEIGTNDLIGNLVTIMKSDKSYVQGRVISVADQKVNLDLSEGSSGIQTNVHLTIKDNDGSEHQGLLFVN
jgi:hypothetical protein